jgi:hypothetical protein
MHLRHLRNIAVRLLLQLGTVIARSTANLKGTVKGKQRSTVNIWGRWKEPPKMMCEFTFARAA